MREEWEASKVTRYIILTSMQKQYLAKTPARIVYISAVVERNEYARMTLHILFLFIRYLHVTLTFT